MRSLRGSAWTLTFDRCRIRIVELEVERFTTPLLAMHRTPLARNLPLFRFDDCRNVPTRERRDQLIPIGEHNPKPRVAVRLRVRENLPRLTHRMDFTADTARILIDQLNRRAFPVPELLTPIRPPFPVFFTRRRRTEQVSLIDTDPSPIQIEAFEELPRPGPAVLRIPHPQLFRIVIDQPDSIANRLRLDLQPRRRILRDRFDVQRQVRPEDSFPVRQPLFEQPPHARIRLAASRRSGHG